MSPSSRKTLSLAILLLVVVLLAAIFWWFRSHYLRSFSEQNAMFEASQLQLPHELSDPGPIRLVHFWDPICPCNVGNQQHLSELIAHYAPLGVEFYSVQKPGTRGELPEMLKGMKAIDPKEISRDLPASPAVALFDHNGELAYLGPYSEGFTCTSANSFIEPAIEALMQDRPIRSTNTLARGCFCNWSD